MLVFQCPRLPSIYTIEDSSLIYSFLHRRDNPAPIFTPVLYAHLGHLVVVCDSAVGLIVVLRGLLPVVTGFIITSGFQGYTVNRDSV